jgi:hypothetical protein
VHQTNVVTLSGATAAVTDIRFTMVTPQVCQVGACHGTRRTSTSHGRDTDG